jgi:hypothetical protein
MTLAHGRAVWPRELARQATTGVLPLNVLPCLSVPEAVVRLEMGQAVGAVLIDVDLDLPRRDFLDLARTLGVAVVAVTSEAAGPLWSRRQTEVANLGIESFLSAPIDRGELLKLTQQSGRRERDRTTERAIAPQPSGVVIAVLGAGGTGASTVGAAIAQGIATSRRVVLADLARRADQAMLHGTEVIPALSELVDAHSARDLTAPEITAMTFDISSRGYRLLAGLRRPRDWSAVRPRALSAALDGLQRCFDVVIADTDCDLDGEADTGSQDVEDQHLLARTAIRRAALVMAVGAPGVKGLHALCRTVHELLEFGIPLSRVQPVLNAAPGGRRHDFTQAYRRLMVASTGSAEELVEPLIVGTHRGVERAHRDGSPLPRSMADSLSKPVFTRLDGLAPSTKPEPAPVRPGSLGLGVAS